MLDYKKSELGSIFIYHLVDNSQGNNHRYEFVRILMSRISSNDL